MSLSIIAFLLQFGQLFRMQNSQTIALLQASFSHRLICFDFSVPKQYFPQQQDRYNSNNLSQYKLPSLCEQSLILKQSTPSIILLLEWPIIVLPYMLASNKKNLTYEEPLLRGYVGQSKIQARRSSTIELPVIRRKSNRQSELNSKRPTNIRQTIQIFVEDKLTLRSYKSAQPEKFKSLQVTTTHTYKQFNLLDMTYSLICAQINLKLLLVLFIFHILVRYFSLVCLVYITIFTYSTYWEWVFSPFSVYCLYLICMVKISLKPPQTQSESILKHVFNSLEQNEAIQYFQVVSKKKLVRTILRGLVPPEFSFLYIRGSQQKNIQIYSMVNFIYSSIESLLFYPFFIIYTALLYDRKTLGVSWIYYTITLALTVLSECIFVTLTLYLLVFGCRRRGFFKSAKKD